MAHPAGLAIALNGRQGDGDQAVIDIGATARGGVGLGVGDPADGLTV